MTKSKKNINNTITNLFQDKCFVIFILFVFIFYIFFYDYIDYKIKEQIFLTFTNPLILIFTIILIGLILYHNFTVGIIIAIALTITITLNHKNNDNNNNNKINNRNNSYEGFKNKGFLMNKIENLTNNLQEGLEENKDILEKYKKKKVDKLENEEENSVKEKEKKNKNINIKKRKFDFSKREDKALVYSREVLKDCIKRINYEYDDKEYLKKYISSKIEEIIDLLGLVNE